MIHTLDKAKIPKKEKYDRYYAVATNSDELVKDILAVSHKRCPIEYCFIVMKTNFLGKLVNHSNPFRIKVHFLICYTVLLINRLLECKLDDQKGVEIPLFYGRFRLLSFFKKLINKF